MDLSKLKTSDWVIGVSAIVLLISSFLDWFTADIGGGDAFISGSVSANGWDLDAWPLWVGLPVLIGLAMLAIVAVRAFSPQTELPQLPIGWGQALFFAGVLSAVLVLLKFLIGEDAGSYPGVDIDVSRSLGIFLALLATIGLAAGGFLQWQDEKSGTSAGTAPPTPF
jgi:hypothetical protein